MCEFVHTALAYLVLLRMEVAAFHPPALLPCRGLVSVALFVTFAPLSAAFMRAGVLPRILLCGARTFLYATSRKGARSGCLADSDCNFTAAGTV